MQGRQCAGFRLPGWKQCPAQGCAWELWCAAGRPASWPPCLCGSDTRLGQDCPPALQLAQLVGPAPFGLQALRAGSTNWATARLASQAWHRCHTSWQRPEQQQQQQASSSACPQRPLAQQVRHPSPSCPVCRAPPQPAAAGKLPQPLDAKGYDTPMRLAGWCAGLGVWLTGLGAGRPASLPPC